MYISQTFFLNFWIWWYLVKGKETAMDAWRIWLYSFEMLRIGPMLGNLFQPFFQDKSWTGRIVAFPIRFIWGTFGLVIQAFFTVVILAGLIGYFVLPIMLILLIFKTIFVLIL